MLSTRQYLSTGLGKTQMSTTKESDFDFSDRLRWLMDRYKLITADMAARCGIPNSTFNRYLNYNSVPTLDNLEKIIGAFPDVSIEWIVLGKGEPFKEHDSAMLETKCTSALEKIHLLEENVSLYKKLIQKN